MWNIGNLLYQFESKIRCGILLIHQGSNEFWISNRFADIENVFIKLGRKLKKEKHLLILQKFFLNFIKFLKTFTDNENVFLNYIQQRIKILNNSQVRKSNNSFV